MIRRLQLGLALGILVISSVLHSAPSADEFLADKLLDTVIIARIRDAETRWMILDYDGDHIPFLRVQADVVEVLRKGSQETTASCELAQFTESEMFGVNLSPPVIVGKKYVVMMRNPPAKERTEGDTGTFWIASPDGVFLIRGEKDAEFFLTGKERIAMADLRAAVNNPPLPLDQIANHVSRFQAAENRLEANNVGDVNSFVKGLSEMVLSPTVSADTDIENPREIPYMSVVRLRDVGMTTGGKELAIADLRKIMDRNSFSLASPAAISLAHLGDRSGMAILIKGLLAPEDTSVSSDGGGSTTYFGNFPFDSSLAQASAYSLGLLGDPKGLQSETTGVVLAACDALLSSTQPELKKAAMDKLKQLSSIFDGDLQRKRNSGELTKKRERNDRLSKYPKEWAKVHALLAREGDDQSFKALVEAWAGESASMPRDNSPVADLKQDVYAFDPPVSGWPSLAQAMLSAEPDRGKLSQRVRKVVAGTSLEKNGEVQALINPSESSKANNRKDDIKMPAEVEKMISSADASVRADGYVAAARYKIPGYRQKTIEAARARNKESMGALYALAMYDEPLDESILRELLTSGPLELRYGAFELATRKHPERFVAEGLQLAQDLTQKNGTDDDRETLAEEFPSLLARIFRTGSAAPEFIGALQKGNPELKMMLIGTIATVGDPDVAVVLKRVAEKDADDSVRQAAAEVLKGVGVE